MFDVFLSLHRVVFRLRQQSTDIADNPGVRGIRSRGLAEGVGLMHRVQLLVVGRASERERHGIEKQTISIQRAGL